MSQILINARGIETGVQWSTNTPVPDNRKRFLFVHGNWDGAQVKVEISPDTRVWFPYEALEDDNWLDMTLPGGVYFRVGIQRPGIDTKLSASYV